MVRSRKMMGMASNRPRTKYRWPLLCCGLMDSTHEDRSVPCQLYSGERERPSITVLIDGQTPVDQSHHFNHHHQLILLKIGVAPRQTRHIPSLARIPDQDLRWKIEANIADLDQKSPVSRRLLCSRTPVASANPDQASSAGGAFGQRR